MKQSDPETWYAKLERSRQERGCWMTQHKFLDQVMDGIQVMATFIVTLWVIVVAVELMVDSICNPYHNPHPRDVFKILLWPLWLTRWLLVNGVLATKFVIVNLYLATVDIIRGR
jgi:hypothetical protein